MHRFFTKQILRFLLPAAMILAGFSPLQAQTSISPMLRVQTGQIKTQRQRAINQGMTPQKAMSEDYIPVIIRVEPGIADLPSYVNQLWYRDDILIATLSMSHLNELMSVPGLLRMETGICNTPEMDQARTFCGEAEIENEFPGVYTGKNVVVGFADTGFDPWHVNFSTADGSGTRVKRLVNYTLGRRTPTRLTTPGEIAEWITDEPDKTHATHVAGILTGSYRENGYHGLAPDAEIVATTSGLNSGYLLAGFEEVVDYAKSQQKPAVINMSISSSTGPHDGTGLFNQYLEKLSEDAVICISAGNNGDKWGGFFSYSHTPEKPKVRVLAREYPIDLPTHVTGIFDVWSLDEKPVTARLLVYDSEEKKVVKVLDTINFAEGKNDVVLFTPDLSQQFEGEPNAELAELFSSVYAHFSAEINPDNNRYNVVFAFDWKNFEGSHRYWLGMELEGKEGVRAEAYASSGVGFMMMGDEYSPAPSNAHSINDLACGRGVMAVGSFQGRGTSAGEVNSFSSFTTLNDGRVFPSFCTPGGSIVSSYSTPYIDAHPEEMSSVWNTVEKAGRRNYWGPLSGTSMASPYAAGVFAQWLQADPTLTPHEVMEIAASTLTPAPDSNKRWGHGILNAYEGLKTVLSLSGVAEVAPDSQSPTEITACSDNIININAFHLNVASVTVHDMTGRTVLSLSPGIPEFTLDLSNLAPGIYVISASNGHSSATLKHLKKS